MPAALQAKLHNYPRLLLSGAAKRLTLSNYVHHLIVLAEKLNVLYERNWTMLVHEQLRRFEGSIVAATRPGVATAGAAAAGGSGGSASALGHFGYDAGDSHSWTFSEALLYSVTVITTIGKWLPRRTDTSLCG